MVKMPDALFPAPLQCLFQPKRTKVLWGGRGAGRSWGVARALLLIGSERAIRVLCVRELQNSISESVHKLLADQIVALGLEAFYDVQVGRIIGRNGTTFAFEGIKNNTSKIKSYEGIDRCWVEEANKVSRSSWEVLIPTIRKEGSEIWLTFNPELDTDYTYQRFVMSPSEQSVVVKMTWRDNPWFPDVLKAEMEDLKARDSSSKGPFTRRSFDGRRRRGGYAPYRGIGNGRLIRSGTLAARPRRRSGSRSAWRCNLGFSRISAMYRRT